MKFQNLLNEIFQIKELKDYPPVLIDIGASESIHKLWKNIAKYSVCIAFDADDREMGYTEKTTKIFNKLYVFNCIVTDNDKDNSNFYLTESPYCSSTLHPFNEKLGRWAYAEKFNVKKVIKINSKSLMSSLQELNFHRIDWFKSDSQGIDLRLFKSLSEDIRNNIVVAEFEPGLIDSYMGEDKLSDVIKYFERQEFWLSDFTVKGSQRITKNQLENIFSSKLLKKLAQFSHKTSPGWAEIVYIREFENSKTSKRELILGWIFATILEQHGYALLLAEIISSKNEGDQYLKMVTDKMKIFSRKKLRRNIWTLRFLPSLFIKLQHSFGIQ